MNNIIIIIMFLFVSETFSQNEIRKFYYADTAIMINLENDFWVIDKEKLNKTKYTGHICFFYDSLKQDTAIYAEVKKGKLQGNTWGQSPTYKKLAKDRTEKTRDFLIWYSDKYYKKALDKSKFELDSEVKDRGDEKSNLQQDRKSEIILNN